MSVTSMHAASREALADAEHRLDGVLADTGADPTAVGGELSSFAEVLSAEIGLRRALSDASASETARNGLLQDLVGGKLSEHAARVLETVVTSRWSSPRELADGVRTLATSALLVAAERDGALDTVESELFGVARALGEDPELEQALSDQTGTAQAKRALVQQVFGGKINPVTQTLLEQTAIRTRGRGVQHGLDALTELAAKRRERSVAHVVTAGPLSEDQRGTLVEKLNRIYGRPIALHVEVRPSVIGGIVVKVGDEVIDGSSAGRIMALRGQLAG
ncbi:MAG: F0F1 ATP synthase subunit delta [Actinophytocola sp.]|nr:F0F1 ATP synthase subunit delta [Actinophytocola sp.]